MKTEITITMNDAGQISVSAPVENPIVCYGLIEAGRDVLREYFAAQKRAVIPATGADLRQLNGHPQ